MKFWLALLALSFALAAHAQPYSFAAFGDMPYNDEERAEIPGMLREMAATGVRFGVHLGDFKSGNEPCSDALYLDREQLFASAAFPLVYTPGENDWISCQRRTSGNREPRERLQALRDLFFTQTAIAAKTGMQIEQQNEIDFNFGANAEHLRWRSDGVLFVTLNVPGNNNNWGVGRVNGSREYQTRMAAVGDWIEKSFAIAKRESLKAVVLLMHANPDFEAWSEGKPTRGFGGLLDQIREELGNYPGEVLLIHGDTHVMRSDRPIKDSSGAVIRRFRRLEVYGSPIPGWVEVKVDPEGERLFRLVNHPLQPDANQLDQLTPDQ
ncbi:MAG: hypothetical protein FWD62_00500 [Betaproteobacteria bacterium]|nr:hypothetical protein [Betaproteobacteria bacterium]